MSSVEETRRELDARHQEAKDKEYAYNKLQVSIRSKVLQDVPERIYILENKKQELKEEFLAKRKSINCEISIIRSSRRKLTREAYLQNIDLQQLKKEKTALWNEVHQISHKLWELEKLENAKNI